MVGFRSPSVDLDRVPAKFSLKYPLSKLLYSTRQLHVQVYVQRFLITGAAKFVFQMPV
jgi:hypothetical protein